MSFSGKSGERYDALGDAVIGFEQHTVKPGGHGHAAKGAAARKYIGFYISDILWNGDLCQRRTVAECEGADDNQMIGQVDLRQLPTVFKGVTLDDGYAVGQGNLGQRMAAMKCFRSNEGYALWHADGNQVIATGECTASDGGDPIREMDGTDMGNPILPGR